MNLSPSVVGLLRGIGTALVFALFTYLGDASHLTGVFTPEVAGLIAGIVLALEHALEAKTGNALFGAVRSR